MGKINTQTNSVRRKQNNYNKLGRKPTASVVGSVSVHKEYPEFLVKDFKTKEELFDFIDEDEPMILKESNICFESVPDCLKEIGFTGFGNDIWDCNHYIARKHDYDYGEDD